MDRGASWATVREVTESDMTEQLTHTVACRHWWAAEVQVFHANFPPSLSLPTASTDGPPSRASSVSVDLVKTLCLSL